mgnify:CR=1 FL=1
MVTDLAHSGMFRSMAGVVQTKLYSGCCCTGKTPFFQNIAHVLFNDIGIINFVAQATANCSK